MPHSKEKGHGFNPASSLPKLATQEQAVEKAADRLEQGEIGHLKQGDNDLISRKVICLDGTIPKDIALELKSIDWDKGIAVVYGGSQYGNKEIRVDQLRRIDAVLKTINNLESN